MVAIVWVGGACHSLSVMQWLCELVGRDVAALGCVVWVLGGRPGNSSKERIWCSSFFQR